MSQSVMVTSTPLNWIPMYMASIRTERTTIREFDPQLMPTPALRTKTLAPNEKAPAPVQPVRDPPEIPVQAIVVQLPFVKAIDPVPDTGRSAVEVTAMLWGVPDNVPEPEVVVEVARSHNPSTLLATPAVMTSVVVERTRRRVWNCPAPTRQM